MEIQYNRRNTVPSWCYSFMADLYMIGVDGLGIWKAMRCRHQLVCGIHLRKCKAGNLAIGNWESVYYAGQ